MRVEAQITYFYKTYFDSDLYLMTSGFLFMKKIKLTKGKFALVDDDMYDELNQFKWQAGKQQNNFYARRGVWNNKKCTTIRMHRHILKLTDSKIKCDHINHNSLDNQTLNLRACTNAENLRNSKSRVGSSSKYKGVSFYKPLNKWRAQIMADDKVTHLGYFKYELEAAQEYDKAAKKYHKEFAVINLI